jgi:hypothetical protein
MDAAGNYRQTVPEASPRSEKSTHSFVTNPTSFIRNIGLVKKKATSPKRSLGACEVKHRGWLVFATLWIVFGHFGSSRDEIPPCAPSSLTTMQSAISPARPGAAPELLLLSSDS